MNDEVWVIRRITPEGTRDLIAGRYYMANRCTWDGRLAMARRFGSRDMAVKEIGRVLKEWPSWWGQVKPVRLVAKSRPA